MGIRLGWSFRSKTRDPAHPRARTGHRGSTTLHARPERPVCPSILHGDEPEIPEHPSERVRERERETVFGFFL
ncbi:hypothetical protein FQA47_021109 [Oryzias melastigma]|uniref:Uncharacterized protein n=1 Tax=Oryzias melastigma TaxID=30732 RepID=A0A834C6W8_ORYME|nr:hypothetical protein FQA47_021109 [Oryzias melastigma]